jgi:hypothetical protein
MTDAPGRPRHRLTDPTQRAKPPDGPQERRALPPRTSATGTGLPSPESRLESVSKG